MDKKTINRLADGALAVLTLAPPPSDWEQAWEATRRSPNDDQVQKNSAVEALFSKLNPTRNSSAEGAFYAPREDAINIPPSFCYRDSRNGETATQAYYHTVFHELAHWTGHPSRLARSLAANGAAYAREELVAETSAVMLTTLFGIAPTDASRHVVYFRFWWDRAGDRGEALQFARVEAERAVAYIMRGRKDPRS